MEFEFFSATKSCSFHFRFLTFINRPTILAALHTLTISSCPLTVNTVAFQSYIAAATNLRTLRLGYRVNPWSMHGPDSSDVTHPGMTSFHYTESSVLSTHCLVNRLNLPAATDFSLATHELAQITGLLKGSLSEVVRLCLGANSPCDVVDLVNLLKGAAKLEDLELTMVWAMLVDSMIEHSERDDSLCPRLRLIEAL